jgi:hypothetical protein
VDVGFYVVFWDTHKGEEGDWSENLYEKGSPASDPENCAPASGLEDDVFLQNGCKLPQAKGAAVSSHTDRFEK